MQLSPTHARYMAARQLIEDERFDDATREMTWLWQHMAEEEPALRGVRLSFFVGELGRLIEQHPPARDAFTAIRDATSVGSRDWIALNTALGDGARTLAWYDEQPPGTVGSWAGMTLVPLLEAAERWPEAGRFLRRVEDEWPTIERLARLLPIDDEPEYDSRPVIRTEVARLVRLYRAAGRDAEAAEVAERARQLDSSPEMAAAVA